MDVQAAAVILTDTKSLSRFSVMKFSSVNVQWSSVSRLPLLSVKGHSCFLWRISLPASLHGWSHSHTHVHTCMSTRPIETCTRRQVRRHHTHVQAHIGTSRGADKQTSCRAPSGWGVHRVTCDSFVLLFGGRGDEWTREPRATYRKISGEFSLDAPRGKSTPTECRRH